MRNVARPNAHLVLTYTGAYWLLCIRPWQVQTAPNSREAGAKGVPAARRLDSVAHFDAPGQWPDRAIGEPRDGATFHARCTAPRVCR
jgi:hypothetical protein